jgi:hypothetical protein
MNDIELDLTKPETIEKLKQLDVMKKKPDEDAEQLDKAIKQVSKSQKFTITLTASQAAHLLRESSTVGKPVKDYLQELVIEKCFSERTGAPLIKRCSHHTATVKGPSGKGLVSRG